MKKYSWLFFDADGTLYDFEKTELIAFQKTFNLIGHPYHPDFLKKYHQINNQLWADFEAGKISLEDLKNNRFNLFFDSLDLKIAPDEFSHHFIEHLAEGHYLLKDAEELIKFLSKDYRLLLLTNGLKEVQRRRFSGSTIIDFFEEIIVSGEVGVAKPGSEIFDLAFAAVGNPQKARVLMVGDSLSSDIAGGLGYGIDTCWFNPNKSINIKDFEPTYEISNLHQLKNILN
ncbi:MAG: noncanonical pyrimidine nucleotidase, YjjG family [Chloroflexi bacterium]|jgi:2-haloacid dehalogenase|nr:noncanonical pyrimidine nucleotidase, YjjG family [Chloroflexota bacterium]MBT3670763.1 noncanonical pyrimidine nucleotidase, YjjG family [Chloroflexota bacterium]MBT4004136.1 noncanonical pyrimidine nucleotidase, YjjG family [Chloroflexota bacterium]MBT4305131.1 noncanonical pyrimidine nucleotidase, YjjG family [Chloroflexota bacterium]MBT4533347.1 noncanonical pyrimidine nucleotidase, YjjG family [Chloroflexota bacterium]